jgi:cell division protein FtsW
MQVTQKLAKWFKFLRTCHLVRSIFIGYFKYSSSLKSSASSSLAYRQMQGNTDPSDLYKHTSLILMVQQQGMWVAHNLDYRYYAGIAKLARFFEPLLLLTWRYSAFRASRGLSRLILPVVNQAFQPI